MGGILQQHSRRQLVCREVFCWIRGHAKRFVPQQCPQILQSSGLLGNAPALCACSIIQQVQRFLQGCSTLLAKDLCHRVAEPLAGIMAIPTTIGVVTHRRLQTTACCQCCHRCLSAVWFNQAQLQQHCNNTLSVHRLPPCLSCSTMWCWRQLARWRNGGQMRAR